MAPKSLTHPPRFERVLDDDAFALRKLARLCDAHFKHYRGQGPDTDFDPADADAVLKIMTKVSARDKPKAWTTSDSHTVEDFAIRDPYDLIYFKGDIVQILDARGWWVLGLNRGRIGIVPLVDLEYDDFVRALDSHEQHLANEIAITKGDVFPAIRSSQDGCLMGFRGDEEGLIPATLIESAKIPFIQRHSGDVYKHEALRQGQIRLICIGNEQFQQMRACKGDTTFITLKTYQWDQAPAYTALSYCWGDASKLATVFCDGKPLRITHNLDVFLKWFLPFDLAGDRQLTEDETIYVWADAICIDQSNLQEKAFQIPFMGTIYKTAKATRVYVGESATTWKVLAAFAIVNQKIQDPGSQAASAEHKQEIMSSLDLGAVSEFFLAPAFQRSWMIQEMVLGKDIQLWYGEAQISLNTISGWIQFQDTHDLSFTDRSGLNAAVGNRGEELGTGIYNADNLGKIRYNWQKGTPKSFIEVLERFRGAKATDLRDKVYSLLSLAGDHYISNLKPSYDQSNTVADVCLELANLAISSPVRTDASRLLQCTGAYDMTSSFTTTLPSWVPDWTIMPCYALDPSFYKCSGNTECAISFSESTSNDLIHRSITVQGAIIDKIGYPGLIWRSNDHEQPLPEHPDVTDRFLASVMVHESVRLFFGKIAEHGLSYGRSDISFEDAIWQTMLCGRALEQRRLKPEDKKYYQAFRRKIGLDPKDAADTGREDHAFSLGVIHYMYGRRVGITAKRYCGAFPNGAERGDVVAILLGFRTPFVLREVEGLSVGTQAYKIIGPAYVHGIMDGELIQQNDGDVQVDGGEIKDLVII